MIHLHKSFHPFLGQKISYKDIFFLILWISLAHTLSVLVDSNFYLEGPLKVIVYSLLLTDITAGCYMNTKKDVIAYYDTHAHHILRFAPYHVYIMLSVFLFDVSWYLPILVYITTVISTTRTLTLIKHKKTFAYIVFLCGAFIFGFIEDGSSLAFVLLQLLFVYKLLISFGTRHYASCPVRFKRG